MRGVELHCGAGTRLKHVANAARDAGLAGLEFLEGIPGCVGGALRMNAGAMGTMTFEAVERVRFMGRDGKVKERPAAEMAAVYRSCPVLRDSIALGAVLRGEPAEPEEVRARMEDFRMRRTFTQPHNRSAGCMFKNPAKKTGRPTRGRVRAKRTSRGRRECFGCARQFHHQRRWRNG